jgi:SAM-dependent methyltransferase
MSSSDADEPSNTLELAGELTTVVFEQAAGRSLPFVDPMSDAAICHITLCHAPEPQLMLREAVRVPRPGGRLARGPHRDDRDGATPNWGTEPTHSGARHAHASAAQPAEGRRLRALGLAASHRGGSS